MAEAFAREVDRKPRRDWPFAACSGVAALLVYARTLAPTVSVEDTGELIAAAYCLGIPHPTGYPLWTLLAHLFTYLPFGGALDPVAWRVNFMSAVFGAGTVALVVLIVARLTGRRLPAVVAGLALAFSREFWEQSVIAEVYTLSAFLLTLCLYLLIRWRESRRYGYLYAFALVHGLSLANHNVLVLTTPVFIAGIVATEGIRGRDIRRHYAFMSGLIALGLSFYLYLPIRSWANPAMDWGNPESWQGFWDTLTRAQYAHIITDQHRSLERFLGQLGLFLDSAAWEFTPWVAWLAVIGAVTLTRRMRWRGRMLLGLFVVFLLGTVLIPNYDLDRKGAWIATAHRLPLYVVAAIWIGDALAVLPQSRLRRAVPLLGAIAILSPLMWHYEANDKSEYLVSRRFAEDVFATMTPDAVYFGSGDHSIFPLSYLQIVHGERPDVLIANPYSYVPPQVYADMPEEMRAGFGPRTTPAEDRVIMAWILENTDRPLYSALRQYVDGASVVNDGLLYRYLRPGEPFEPRPVEDRGYAERAKAAEGVYDDWTAEQIAYDYRHAMMRASLDDGDTVAALEALARARDAARDNAILLNNLGGELALYKEYATAETLFDAALSYWPEYVPAHLNRIRVLVLAGREQEAIEALQAALNTFPDDLRVQRLARQVEQRR